MGVSQSTAVSDFQAQNPMPTKCYVNGTEIPPSTVDVHLRKGGPLDINRYAEVQFASPWADTDYLSLFGSLTDDQTKPDTLRIDVRNQDTETYSTVFHGIVTGVGDSPDSNNKIHQCRAQGPEHYLQKIPASKVYSSGVQIQEILGYVTSELSEDFPLSVSVAGVGGSDTQNTIGVVDLPSFVISVVGIFQDVDQLTTPKTFTANKHTLSDVLDWATDKVGGRVWLQPTKEGAEMVFTQSPTEQSRDHRGHYLNDGSLRIIDNSALKEIKPINQITLNGRASKTFAEVGEFEINSPSDTYTQVTARHTELYERNGEKPLTDTIRKSDSESKQEVEKEAKSILKKRVDEATGGSMQVVLVDSLVEPFDTIEAKPTVGRQTAPVEPIEYEVSRSHYKIRPNEPDTVDHIDLNCGVHTDLDEDIEIITTNTKDA
jgi:hypothetical protein